MESILGGILIKTVSFLVYLLLYSSLIFADEVFYLKDDPDCGIQAWKENKLVKISSKYALGIPLRAVRLKRNPSLMAFKIDGQVYVAKMNCLASDQADSFDNLEESVSRQSNQKYYDRIDNRMGEYTEFQRNKYFVEIEGGAASVSSKTQIIPDYTLFNTDDGAGTNVIFDKKANNSKYKVKNVFGFTYGNQFSEDSFWALKVKRLSGAKTDSVPFTLSGASTGNGILDYEYTDTLLNLYIGGKFMFLKYSSFKPSISLFIGLSMLDGKMKVDGEELLKYSATDFAGQAEIGGEYLFTSHFSLGAYLGYEYLGQKNLKAKDKSGNLTKDSKKTILSYSNIYGTLGVTYYFK